MDEIIEWIRTHKNNEGKYVIPSQYSTDETEKKHGKWISQNFQSSKTGLSKSANELFYEYFVPDDIRDHLDLTPQLQKRLEASCRLF